MNLIAFTLIRNGFKYDYPFFESIASLHDLCGEVFIAVGEGEDKTEEVISNLDYTKVIRTVWDENLRTGGVILSQQTNIALAELRKFYKDGWAFYLQGDEVLNQDDFALIKRDLKLAEKQGCDAVSFRYFHFWQRYDHIAIRKNWYPQEIRAIRIDSDIWSAGDAQSFKNATNIFYSDASIYHYGHVRTEDKYQLKQHDFHRWWHKDEDLDKARKKHRKNDQKQPILIFHGIHPKYMASKLEASGIIPRKLEKVVFVLDSNQKLNEEFLKRVYADSVSTSYRMIPRDTTTLVVDIRRSGWRKFFKKIPDKMYSKLAHPWPLETYAMLELSRLGGWLK